MFDWPHACEPGLLILILPGFIREAIFRCPSCRSRRAAGSSANSHRQTPGSGPAQIRYVTAPGNSESNFMPGSQRGGPVRKPRRFRRPYFAGLGRRRLGLSFRNHTPTAIRRGRSAQSGSGLGEMTPPQGPRPILRSRDSVFRCNGGGLPSLLRISASCLVGHGDRAIAP